MERFPRVVRVGALPGHCLRVAFDNGQERLYDCTPLLESEAFRPLTNERFFASVHADPHGYGVLWSDDVDLAESELWLGGSPV